MQRFILSVYFLFAAVTSPVVLASSDTNNAFHLSSEQRQWITEHPVVRVGLTPDWAPFSFFAKNGEAAGIDIDILRLIHQRTGLRFQVVATESWDETLRLARDKQIDCTTSTAQTSEREKIFHFTRPYYSSPVVIISREHDLRFYHVTLLRDATIAMPKDHITTMALTGRLPKAHFIEADTMLDCFRLVAQGKADATVANMIVTSRYLNDHPELNLIISGVTDESFPLRLAIRREAPMLASILDGALGSISTEELDGISDRHLPFGLQAAQRGAIWQRRWIEVLIAAAALSIGLLLWIRSINREVRARRRAEAELREINKSLEVFSYTISHDLRAPLRTIRGFAAILIEDYKDQISSEANDYLDRMNSAAGRMDNLISDVLAYSQASRSNLPLHPVDLNRLIDQLISEYPFMEQDYFHVEPNLPSVLANTALLSQSISNLIGNAIKFIPADREPDIHIHVDQNGGLAKLWVEDNGIGIATEDQARIFKMFERINARQYEGSGIGLAVVAKAVEKMGGTFGVESEMGKGSRFWIQLPLTNEDRQAGNSPTDRAIISIFPSRGSTPHPPS